MDFFSILSDGQNLLHNLADPINSPYVITPGYIWFSIVFGLLDKWTALSLYIFGFLGFTSWYLYKNVIALNMTNLRAVYYVALIILTSFPIWFLADRGNIEGLQFILLALFVQTYTQEKHILSILLLSLSLCMKPFAIVFVVLYINRKQYKYLGLLVVASLFIILTSLSLLPGTSADNLHGMNLGMKYYDSLWIIGGRGAQFNHTMYTPLWIINYMVNWVTPEMLKQVYFLVHGSLFVGISTYIIYFEKKIWRKLFLLYLCMIGLPFISADYTLIHLYVPAVLMFQSFNAEADDKTKGYYRIITILLALLLIPKQYLSGLVVPIGASVIINPILIYMLFIVLIKFGLDDRRKLMQIG